ncbi:PREDICTED: UPF0562 protein C7orf55 homolog [Myotis brandtii]|uniref:UPF0562 protein C7orf55 homolog n=1 Tax=Myotis brandtii TaxID=109478 RepID=UPI0007040472|nr:PREDICTED: UPF0562 protein C7orf55 homolog [Myotis brandtii]
MRLKQGSVQAGPGVGTRRGRGEPLRLWSRANDRCVSEKRLVRGDSRRLGQCVLRARLRNVASLLLRRRGDHPAGNASARPCARPVSAGRDGAVWRVTSEKLCRAQHELHFQAATYLCLLRSVREHVALHQEFHGKGERSVEEAAGLVGLKLPHQPGGKGWEP